MNWSWMMILWFGVVAIATRVGRKHPKSNKTVATSSSRPSSSKGRGKKVAQVHEEEEYGNEGIEEEEEEAYKSGKRKNEETADLGDEDWW